MKNLCSLLVVAGFVPFFVAPALGAIVDPHTGDYVVLTIASPGESPNVNGGAFIVKEYTNYSDIAAGNVYKQWTTYCVENGVTPADELFNPGNVYQLADSTTPPNTGVSASGKITESGNILSNVSRYLYYTAMTNPNALFGASSISGTNETFLQEAIWLGEENSLHGGLAESGTGAISNAIAGLGPNIAQGAVDLYNKAVTTLGGVTLSLSDAQTYDSKWLNTQSLNWGNSNYVGIINPLGGLDPTTHQASGNSPAQSQLYITSVGQEAAVPEPASLIVWSVLGAGAAGMAIRRRSGARWATENRKAIQSVIESKLHS